MRIAGGMGCRDHFLVTTRVCPAPRSCIPGQPLPNQKSAASTCMLVVLGWIRLHELV